MTRDGSELQLHVWYELKCLRGADILKSRKLSSEASDNLGKQNGTTLILPHSPPQ